MRSIGSHGVFQQHEIAGTLNRSCGSVRSLAEDHMREEKIISKLYSQTAWQIIQTRLAVL